MAGAKEIFNALYDTFQGTEFFQGALYPFSWTDVIATSIDRSTGATVSTTETYSCNAFFVNPSKTERPQDSVFRDIKAGDIAVSVQQNELIKAPPQDHAVTFKGEEYICKEIVSDTVGVAWRLLLRK